MAFSGWKFSFCSWLSFGGQRFQKCFDERDKLSPTDETPAYSEVERELSVKLFAILASYLKGRCVGMVKSLAKSKDAFGLGPSSRQRSLAIAQTLSNYPSSSTSKTILEQILGYEQLGSTFRRGFCFDLSL